MIRVTISTLLVDTLEDSSHRTALALNVYSESIKVSVRGDLRDPLAREKRCTIHRSRSSSHFRRSANGTETGEERKDGRCRAFVNAYRREEEAFTRGPRCSANLSDSRLRNHKSPVLGKGTVSDLWWRT